MVKRTIISAISKTARPVVQANVQLFFAMGAALLAWNFLPLRPGELLNAIVFWVAALVAVALAFQGLKLLGEDYKLRLAWAAAQQPTTDKHDGRWATTEEIATSGMYDGKGRLLGADMDGHLLFEPHKYRPAFSFFLGAQGSGKTSTQVFASGILSPFSERKQPITSKDGQR